MEEELRKLKEEFITKVEKAFNDGQMTKDKRDCYLRFADFYVREIYRELYKEREDEVTRISADNFGVSMGLRNGKSIVFPKHVRIPKGEELDNYIKKLEESGEMEYIVPDLNSISPKEKVSKKGIDVKKIIATVTALLFFGGISYGFMNKGEHPDEHSIISSSDYKPISGEEGEEIVEKGFDDNIPLYDEEITLNDVMLEYLQKFKSDNIETLDAYEIDKERIYKAAITDIEQYCIMHSNEIIGLPGGGEKRNSSKAEELSEFRGPDVIINEFKIKTNMTSEYQYAFNVKYTANNKEKSITITIPANELTGNMVAALMCNNFQKYSDSKLAKIYIYILTQTSRPAYENEHSENPDASYYTNKELRILETYIRNELPNARQFNPQIMRKQLERMIEEHRKYLEQENGRYGISK